MCGDGAPTLLMHCFPSLGSETSACCTGVTLLAPTLDVASRVWPVVPLYDFIWSIVDAKSSSGRSSMEFHQYSLHVAPRQDCSGCLGSSIGRLPIALQHSSLTTGEFSWAQQLWSAMSFHSGDVQLPLPIGSAPRRQPAAPSSSRHRPSHTQRQ
jgi:hypothetical protein